MFRCEMPRRGKSYGPWGGDRFTHPAVEGGKLKVVSYKIEVAKERYKLNIRKVRIVSICFVFLLLAVSAGIWFLKTTQDTQNQRKEYAEIFEAYAPFGLLYSEKENRLYYGGELVRYFEDLISTEHYLKWPNQDGTVDVYVERNVSGELVGIKSFNQQEFLGRTSSLKTAGHDLEITINIDGYTSDVEEMVEKLIAEEYEIYRQYGLIYDMDRGRLYLDGELVGYFEDKELNHYFGPYEDSTIKIYAMRDKNGDLYGLDVRDTP